MKKLLLALVFAVQSLIGAEALAAACTTTTIASYVGLGSTGCEIGSLRFSNFVLLATTPTGSVPFPSLSIAPVSAGSTIGLDFRVGASVTAPTFLDNLISYQVTGLFGASVSSAMLFLSGSSASGDGVVFAVENLCLGGTFTGADGVTGCTGIARDLIVANFGGGPDPSASLAFLSAASLAVVTDFGVDGGSLLAGVPPGTAALAFVGNRFLVTPRVVPEPASILLIAAGLFALFGYRAARPLRASRAS